MTRFLFTLGLLILTSVPAVAEPTIADPTALNFLGARRPARPSLASSTRLSRLDRVGWKTADWESQLISDLADGSLDQRSLLEAALIVGGVRDQMALDFCRKRWRQILDRFEMAQAPSASINAQSANSQALHVFRLMHDLVLTGSYCEDCDALDRTLLSGDYNCVTATIVFCCLAKHCGLPVRPVSLPGHVRCQVIGHNPCNVETTDPNWEPATDIRDGALGRPLTDVELLAKLFYNRGLAKLAQRDFAAALAATELSWQLDQQHESARDNVATVINNWALDLTAKAEFAQALSLLERGQRLVPDHPILYANQAHIRDAWNRQMGTLGQR